jgi:hypothetical protein
MEMRKKHKGTRKKTEEIRAFFASLPISEQHRLIQFFAQQFGISIPQRDWRDYTGDGSLKAPGLAKTAVT